MDVRKVLLAGATALLVVFFLVKAFTFPETYSGFVQDYEGVRILFVWMGILNAIFIYHIIWSDRKEQK